MSSSSRDTNSTDVQHSRTSNEVDVGPSIHDREQELCKGEGKFSVVAETAPYAIFIYGPERFLYVNPATERITGYSRAELLTMNFWAVVHPEDQGLIRERGQARMRGEAVPSRYEFRILRKDGAARWIDFTAGVTEYEDRTAGLGTAFDITDRKDTENRLQVQQAYLQQLFESAPEGIVILEGDDRIIRANPEFLHMFGYSEEEVTGRFINDLIVPPGKESEAHGYSLQAKMALPLDFESTRCRKSGTLLDVWSLGRPILVNDKQIARYAIYRDITERKRAEKLQSALYRISEEATTAEDLGKFYKVIHETVADLLYARNFYIALLSDDRTALHFVYGVDEVDTFESPEIAVPLKKGCTEYVLRTATTEQITRERFSVLAEINEIEQVGTPSVDWLGAPLKSGDKIFGVIVVQSYDTKVRYQDADKEILTFVSQHVATAIERKRNLDALRKSEAKYRSLVDSAVYAIFVCAPSGRVIGANSALAKMLGYASIQELLALDLARDICADAGDCEKITARLREESQLVAIETRWKRRDGSTVSVRLSGRRLLNSSGVVEAFEMIAEDITEQRRLEEQLRQSQKMEAVGRLAGGLAHDFNNLLTVIKGYSELMVNGLNEADPLHGEAIEINRAADRAASLTRQLLAFSRQQVLAPRVLDLNQIVVGMEKLLRRLLGEDVRLHAVLEPTLGVVRVDPGQVEQVIMNLSVNARDAMPKGGMLTIETANVRLDEAYVREHLGAGSGNYVMLAVSDTGAGMSSEVKSRIFEPFFTTKELGKGTGLGLSTVYGIVKQSEGYVSAYSEVGVGTTFKVYFPRVDGLPDSGKSRAVKRTRYRGTETVLLVEDEDGVRSLVRQVLQDGGYTVVDARNAGAALLICARHPTEIHLLVSDVVLEDMSGRELVNRLSDARPEMKVLFMSGYTDDTIIRHGILQEGTAFLQKPFTTEALARKVRAVLDGTLEE